MQRENFQLPKWLLLGAIFIAMFLVALNYADLDGAFFHKIKFYLAELAGVAGLPEELVVPVLKTNYQYGEWVVINYGPRDNMATNVQAALNGEPITSGQRVDLIKSGENTLTFTANRTSDSGLITYTQKFTVSSATPQLIRELARRTAGGVGGGQPEVVDEPEYVPDEELVIMPELKKEYSYGDEITLDYGPRLDGTAPKQVPRAINLEMRFNGLDISYLGKKIKLSRGGENIVTLTGRRRQGELFKIEKKFNVAGVPLGNYGLKEGDVISAVGFGDPDIYIVNEFGYKRLFINPIIFGFYKHLGFEKVKKINSVARDSFPISGIFRNCEDNDPKIYALEVGGEDTGVLHWIDVAAEKILEQDPNFFKKVFCINRNEFNWYTMKGKVFGFEHDSLELIPEYKARP